MYIKHKPVYRYIWTGYYFLHGKLITVSVLGEGIFSWVALQLCEPNMRITALV